MRGEGEAGSSPAAPTQDKTKGWTVNGCAWLIAVALLLGIATGRITSSRGGIHVIAALVFLLVLGVLRRFAY